MKTSFSKEESSPQERADGERENAKSPVGAWLKDEPRPRPLTPPQHADVPGTPPGTSDSGDCDSAGQRCGVETELTERK
jgi:hypothetical protein